MSLTDSVDYSRLNNILVKVKSHILAAECHGLLCGMLCADKKTGKANWIAIVLEDAELKADDAKECLLLLDKLYNITEIQLRDEELSFELLLPSDNNHISGRAEAIGKWCQGFLLGIVKNDEQSGQGFEYPEEVREIIRDFSEITKIDNQLDNDEDDEEALFQLTEFVRVGGLLAYESM